MPMHPDEQGSSPANGFGHLTDTPDTDNSGRVGTMEFDDTDSTAPAGAGDQDDGTDEVDMSEMQRLLDEQEGSFKSIKRGDVVEGQVVRIDPEEILVDIGLKSEGVLSTKELPGQGYGSLAELKVGDNVLVYVMQPETPEGHAIVSIRRARLERQWRIAQEQYERGELLEAEVIDHNKGGLIVNLEGIRGFVPISQILNLKREDTADNAETQTKLQSMLNRRLQLKIIEINRNRNRLILSERLAVQEWRQRRREELLNELQVGEVRKGVVSNLANFGAFVDLGGADGLVHISQLAWSRVNHPSEVLKVGQEVEVQVLSVDKEKKKIALSIKRAEVDPWTTVEQRYQPDQLVKGTITKIAPFGAFARIEDGVEGLIHLSELPAGMQDPKTALHEGQEVTVRILRIDAERRRLGLSVRQALEGADAEAPAMPSTPDEQAEPANGRTEPVATGSGTAVGSAHPAPPPARPAPPEEPQTAFAAAFRAAQANLDRGQTATTPDGAAPPEPTMSEPTVSDMAVSRDANEPEAMPVDTGPTLPEPALAQAEAPTESPPSTSEAAAPEAAAPEAAAPEAATPEVAPADVAPDAPAAADAPAATELAAAESPAVSDADASEASTPTS
ncbi:MAG TPA: S1 RNA-binding domain-containing protein, partial [Ktedonobacterales bacterium]|nr:S1 RNA-binding domain-containing protein [Ktedonobacterales bacterium]